MEQIKRILAEIRRLKNELEGYSAQEVLDYIESYINIISREQPSSSDLDEAAEEFGKRQGLELKPFAKKYFKAGAEWMAGRGWISVDERLPEMDEEVIVLSDELGTAPIYKIAFGHIVDVNRCIDYNGWNIPGVKYWMPCPEIPGMND